MKVGADIISCACEGGLIVPEKKHIRFHDRVLAPTSVRDNLVQLRAYGPWEIRELENHTLSFQCMASKMMNSGALCVTG